MIIKTSLAKAAACNAITGLADSGSDRSSGFISLMTTDASTIVSLSMSNPAFMTSYDGTSYANPIYDATALRDGNAVYFTLNNRDSSEIFRGAVSTRGGGGDLVLNYTSILEDSTVSITSFKYNVPS